VGAVALSMAAACAAVLPLDEAAAAPPSGTDAAGGSQAPADWGAGTGPLCDGLDASLCMLPFPNDYDTSPDPSMVTGRRVDIPASAFPTTDGGTPFDPTAWDGNDGFSPGSTILTRVPGLSLSSSHVATVSDIGASLSADSPVVLVDARTGRRWPTWSEFDAKDTDPATQLLIIHPARNLEEGDRYIVALRDLETASGARIAPGPAFAGVLGRSPSPPGTPHSSASGAGVGTGTGTGAVSSAYGDHLRAVVQELHRDGVSSSGLFLAWDFTVDSTRNLTAPALTMRDQTFASLGQGVGAYTVTKDVVDPPGQPDLARVVTGTFAVPSYLTGTPGATGSLLDVGTTGLPVHQPGNVYHADFECAIPKTATTAHPASVGVYGHGLFNAADEVTQSAVPQYSNTYDTVFCGTDWVGLSSSTVPLAVSVVNDIDAFPTLVDNLLQALLNAQVLGNLLANPKGFAGSPAFEDAQHRPLIRPSSGVVYYGNSEGGIMGGAFTALSTEVRRSVLGVPGMDYAVLLPRSADFTPFQSALDKTYPDRAAQQLAYDVMQMLWDRAEADGYAEQITSGLPATPSHQVLLEEAFGDHQVSNITTETEARTIGARLHVPALASGRSPQAQPFWGLSALRTPSGGPALFVWDTGVPAEPLSDTAPTEGADPHDTTPRTFPAFWAQMHTFFTTGEISDPCGAHPCTGPHPRPSS
jgi:hypothetical protein